MIQDYDDMMNHLFYIVSLRFYRLFYLKHTFDSPVMCHLDTKFPLDSDSLVLASSAVIYQDNVAKLKPTPDILTTGCEVSRFWYWRLILSLYPAKEEHRYKITPCRIGLPQI